MPVTRLVAHLVAVLVTGGKDSRAKPSLALVSVPILLAGAHGPHPAWSGQA